MKIYSNFAQNKRVNYTRVNGPNYVGHLPSEWKLVAKFAEDGHGSERFAVACGKLVPSLHLYYREQLGRTEEVSTFLHERRFPGKRYPPKRRRREYQEV